MYTHIHTYINIKKYDYFSSYNKWKQIKWASLTYEIKSALLQFKCEKLKNENENFCSINLL